MSLIFLSVASKTATNGGLVSAFLEDVARLHDKYPQHTFICPVIQGYSILPYMQDQCTDWEVWKPHCEALVKACEELWVILGEGWRSPAFSGPENTSIGVAAEIRCAIDMGRKVCFIDPDGI